MGFPKLSLDRKFFLEIAWDDSYRQFLTSSTNKIHEKKFWSQNLTQTGQNRVWN